MSAHETVNTHGRTRLSFANEADIDEFVVMLGEVRAWRDYAGSVAVVPPAARHLRTAAVVRRVDAAGEDSAGRDHERAARARSPRSATDTPASSGTSRRGRTFSSTSCKLHDIEPAMRLLADVGHDDARGVRQLGAQHHRVSVCRARPTNCSTSRRTRRRRRASCCGIGLSSTLPRKFKIAFEGLPRGSHRHRDQRPRRSSAELGPDGERGFRVTAGGGTAIMCKSAGMHSRVHPGDRNLPRVRSHAARVQGARRLPAQAAQSHEVHDQEARVGPLASRSTRRALDGVPRRRRCRC